MHGNSAVILSKSWVKTSGVKLENIFKQMKTKRGGANWTQQEQHEEESVEQPTPTSSEEDAEAKPASPLRKTRASKSASTEGITIIIYKNQRGTRKQYNWDFWKSRITLMNFCLNIKRKIKIANASIV